MYKLISAFITFIAIATITACSGTSTDNNPYKLQEGDILFQDLNCGDMCDAIESVTEGVNGRDFSHCAIVINDNDTLKVIEAIGDGVTINSLHQFLARSGDTSELNNIVVGRLKDADRNLIKQATLFARQQVGKSYDSEFIMNNGKYYCSELVYDAFKYGNNGNELFTLAPMTFKAPQSDSFMPVWVTYYQELNKPIPEAEPGINPGLISRSDKLIIVE